MAMRIMSSLVVFVVLINLMSLAEAQTCRDFWHIPARQEDYPFCEAQVMGWQVLPSGAYSEVVNTVTSLVISFFGVWALFYLENKMNDILITISYASLIWTGVASAMYHFAFYHGFGQFDSMAMTLTLYTALIALAFELCEQLCGERRKNVWKKVMAILLSTYIVIDLTVDALNISWAFEAMFGIPFLLVAATLPVLVFGDMPSKDPDQVHLLRKLALIGPCVGALTFFGWIVDRWGCASYPWLAYLCLHGFWHIGMGYMSISLFAIYSFMRADQFQCTPHIHMSAGFMPIVDWTPMPVRGGTVQCHSPLLFETKIDA